MKNYFFVSLFFLIISCSSSNSVYWCGDHPCINKKEKEAYFKKTMIVEVKDLKRNSYKDKSELEKILQQAQKSEKKIIYNEKELTKQSNQEEKRRIDKEKQLLKQARLEEKKRIDNEKELTKQSKLEEKRRIKEEKELLKEIKLEEKKRNKVEKKTLNKKVEIKQKKITKKNITLASSIQNAEISSNRFGELVEKIIKKNSFRPYPDINNIPN